MRRSPVNISGISESRVAPVAAHIKKEKGGQGNSFLADKGGEACDRPFFFL